MLWQLEERRVQASLLRNLQESMDTKFSLETQSTRDLRKKQSRSDGMRQRLRQSDTCKKPEQKYYSCLFCVAV
jgi:hypothetical protein